VCYCWYRLPSPSFWFGAVAVGHDGVVTTMHVFDGGSHVVTCIGVGAGGTHVVAVEPESMGPTIVHVHAIISDHGWGLGSTRGTGDDWRPRR